MSKDLEVLRMRLKSGEYDGVHIMKAWIAIEELIQLREELEALKASIPEIQNNEVIETLNIIIYDIDACHTLYAKRKAKWLIKQLTLAPNNSEADPKPK